MKLNSLRNGPNRAGTVALLAATMSLLAWLPAASAEQFDVEQYAGKVVVLDFWASWCVPCRRSFPWLNSMQAKFADRGLVIVGVNLDMERADAERFLEDYPAEFSIIYDDNQELARAYGVVAMPSSYVIGRDGSIVAQHMGFKVKQQDEYEAIIAEALHESEQKQ